MPDIALPLSVIYSDAYLLAIDKPGGMPVHPQRAGETGTLVNALLAHYPELAGLGGDTLFPAFAHRIDTGTSGRFPPRAEPRLSSSNSPAGEVMRPLPAPGP